MTNHHFYLYIDNLLFLIQERAKKKLWIESMENTITEEIVQLELELQLLTKIKLIETTLLEVTVEAEKLVALINLLDILTLKLFFLVTKRTFNKNWRTQLFWKMGRHSTLRRKVKLLILIKWTWKQLVETLLKTLKLDLEPKKQKEWMMIKNQLLDFHLIKRVSLTGKMVRTIYFMKNIHNILSTLYLLRVSLTTNKTLMKNSKENLKNITKCCKQLDKIRMLWLD